MPKLPQQQLSSQKTTSTVSTLTNATLANITPQDPTKINKANNISATPQSTLDDSAESPVFQQIYKAVLISYLHFLVLLYL